MTMHAPLSPSGRQRSGCPARRKCWLASRAPGESRRTCRQRTSRLTDRVDRQQLGVGVAASASIPVIAAAGAAVGIRLALYGGFSIGAELYGAVSGDRFYH